MITVWKFPLIQGNGALTVASYIRMPIEAQVLHVEEQDGVPCIWARVNSEAETEMRRFEVVGTGHEAPSEEQARHVATYFSMGGLFVWHLFEEIEV